MCKMILKIGFKVIVCISFSPLAYYVSIFLKVIFCLIKNSWVGEAVITMFFYILSARLDINFHFQNDIESF